MVQVEKASSWEKHILNKRLLQVNNAIIKL